jgi:uncharacterized membrane protein YeiH
MPDAKDPVSDSTAHLLYVVDLAGIFVFALEGALAGMAGSLDLLGVMVLAFTTALAGGVMRDVLIGAAPPMAIRDWRYPTVAFVAAGLAFVLHGIAERVPGVMLMVLDAAGLSLFAMAGTEKALAYGIHPFVAILMGAITGAGGGTIRDMMLAQVPAVLHKEIYATAALFGSAIMVVTLKLSTSPALAAATGASACFGLRVISVWQQWNLPRVATGP